MKSSNSEPRTATDNDVKSKPLIPTPKSKLARNPPIIAPTIPRTTAPTKPPFAGDGSIAFAITPTISPNTNHDRRFIISHPLFNISTIYGSVFT